jgi:hypothetical protein
MKIMVLSSSGRLRSFFKFLLLGRITLRHHRARLPQSETKFPKYPFNLFLAVILFLGKGYVIENSPVNYERLRLNEHEIAHPRSAKIGDLK